MKKIFILLNTLIAPFTYAVVNSNFDIYNHSTHKIHVTLTPIDCMVYGYTGNPMHKEEFDINPLSSYKENNYYPSLLSLGADKSALNWCTHVSSRFSIKVNYDGQPTDSEIQNTISIHWNLGYSHHNSAQLHQYPSEASNLHWQRFGFNSDPYWAENRQVYWNGTDDDNLNGLIIIDYYDCDDRASCW
ncbi:MAG TPA: hypothetical protein PKD00_10165 [Burkholderiales bacterium]|nr:hypothetical protein [Burkholderiales bacterium]